MNFSDIQYKQPDIAAIKTKMDAICDKFASTNNVEEEIQEPISDLCDNITFSVNVKPILDSNCIQCHSAGGNFPNLTDINIVIQNANRIKSEVVSREMPKNGSLTQEEIDIISCWVDAGAINN